MADRNEYKIHLKKEQLKNDPIDQARVVHQVDKEGVFKKVLDDNCSSLIDFYGVNYRGEVNKTMKNVPLRQLRNRRCTSALNER